MLNDDEAVQSKTKFKLFLAMLLIFIAGGVTGGVGVMSFVQSKVEDMKSMDPVRMGKAVMFHLNRKLGLSDSQEEKVRPIILKALHESQSIRLEARNKSIESLKKTSVEITSILEDSQKPGLEGWVEELSERSQQFHPK